MSPGTPTHPRRCGGRAPSVKAEGHHHQLISQRVEECRGGRAHRDPLEGLKWQEGGLSEDLWDLVKKHKARSRLRPIDWVGAGNLSQFLVTVCESDAHTWKGTPLIPLLLHFTGGETEDQQGRTTDRILFNNREGRV